MRRIIPCLLAVIALGAAAPSVRAQNQWEQQIRDRLAGVRGVLQDSGYAQMSDLRVSSLKVRQAEGLTVELQAGPRYFIAGACDDDCTDFDLFLMDASGATLAQDVQEDAIPMLAFTVDRSGTYTVRAAMVACSSEPCFYGFTVYARGAGAVAAAPQQPGERTEFGRLEAGDDTLRSGEYADVYRFEGRKGQHVILDLRSQEFDPYLMLRGPGEQKEDNDDHEGDSHRSLVSVDLQEDGTYRVYTTTYKKGEAGTYELRMQLGGAGAVAAAAAAGPRRERGRLQSGDETLKSGEYSDEYAFDGAVGQDVAVELSSSAFDTYLIVIDPAGKQNENDDEGSSGHSAVRMRLTEPGRYRVIVTSYKPGETGEYELTITTGQAVGPQQQRDLTPIVLGESVTGELGEDDGQTDEGAYRDLYVFNGQEGQSVTIQLTSSDLDGLLTLVPPSGEQITNDDYCPGGACGGTGENVSRIDVTLRESGRYRIVATHYWGGQPVSGSYRLTLNEAAPGPIVEEPTAPTGGHVYGVFAGISDYPGQNNDLEYTADDAVRVLNAMVRGAGMGQADGILLQNSAATRDAVRSAIRTAASRMGPDDTFIFFYSGHGSRRPHEGQPERADPDGLDETIVLYDDQVTDNEFSEWLTDVRAGRVLLVLDACFSGGFSKDVISEPGRMGMFSSEEDVTSLVARKFQAGGFLSAFLADAIGEQQADEDRDGQISALELSQYVYERYRADVKSTDPGDFVRVGRSMGYQHLVVDRGSIGPYDVLFR